MATTLVTLRQSLGKLTGSYIGGSTTTNITTNNNIIDSKLANIFYNDDELNNLYWVWLSTTANPSVERTVSDYTASTGTIVIRGAALSAESASQSFELHKFRPTDIKDALNAASAQEYNYIWKEVVDTSITTAADTNSYAVPAGITDIDEICLVRQEDPDDYCLLHNWNIVNSYIIFPYVPLAGYKLRIRGRTPLTTLSADTSAVEIDAPQTDILLYAAIVNLYQQYKARKAGSISANYDSDIAYYMSLLNESRRYGMTRVSTLPVASYWR